MRKAFNKVSKEHWGVKVGDKFRLIKNHHEIHHDFPKDSICVVMGISHFPTMYHLKDLETSKTLTVPVHSVERMP